MSRRGRQERQSDIPWGDLRLWEGSGQAEGPHLCTNSMHQASSQFINTNEFIYCYQRSLTCLPRVLWIEEWLSMNSIFSVIGEMLLPGMRYYFPFMCTSRLLSNLCEGTMLERVQAGVWAQSCLIPMSFHFLHQAIFHNIRLKKKQKTQNQLLQIVKVTHAYYRKLGKQIKL